MSFDRNPDVPPQMFHATIRENKRGLVGTPIPTDMIRKRLTAFLASEISRCVQVTEDKYSTEYRLEVYVLTADQVERLVQRRAERLYPGIPSVVEV